MTEAEIIRRESPEMKALIAGLTSVAEQMSEVAATHRPLFGGDVYLTGREVTERLFISRRTLQEYRDRGLLPYTRIGGKMLYKLSDLERLLRENYRTQTPLRPLVSPTNPKIHDTEKERVLLLPPAISVLFERLSPRTAGRRGVYPCPIGRRGAGL